MKFRVRGNNSPLRKQLHRRTGGDSANAEPVLYPLHTPFHRLRFVTVWMVGAGLVNAQSFDGFCVARLLRVHSDDMKEFIVSRSVHGESYSDDHGVCD